MLVWKLISFFLVLILVVDIVLAGPTVKKKKKKKACKVNGKKFKNGRTVIEDKDLCAKVVCKKRKLVARFSDNCECFPVCRGDRCSPPVNCHTCLDEKDEVCGSNGVTYDNECLLNSAAIPCGTEDITLAHTGPCERCASVCPAVSEPVCSSDNVTYGNPCLLGIAQCRNGKISFAHDGPCDGCSAICPAIFQPVCGSDGVTYGNNCTLSIAHCRDESITFDHDGLCEAPGTEESLCGKCPKEKDFRPVCGTDGVTYSNLCLLEAAQCEGAEVELAFEGACETSNRVKRARRKKKKKNKCTVNKEEYEIGDLILTLPDHCLKLSCGQNKKGKRVLVFEPLETLVPCQCIETLK